MEVNGKASRGRRFDLACAGLPGSSSRPGLDSSLPEGVVDHRRDSVVAFSRFVKVRSGRRPDTKPSRRHSDAADLDSSLSAAEIGHDLGVRIGVLWPRYNVAVANVFKKQAPFGGSGWRAFVDHGWSRPCAKLRASFLSSRLVFSSQIVRTSDHLQGARGLQMAGALLGRPPGGGWWMSFLMVTVAARSEYLAWIQDLLGDAPRSGVRRDAWHRTRRWVGGAGWKPRDTLILACLAAAGLPTLVSIMIAVSMLGMRAQSSWSRRAFSRRGVVRRYISGLWSSMFYPLVLLFKIIGVSFIGVRIYFLGLALITSLLGFLAVRRYTHL